MPDLFLLNLLFFILGLLIIVRGSDLILDSAIWIAKASGVSQVVIGATIVSFCTTLPELVSSSAAALKGVGDMAVGNAIGSIICNTGLILGLVLFFSIARIKREVFLIKGTFMLSALLMALFLLWPAQPNADFVFIRQEGLVLLVFMVVFLVVNYYESIHNIEELPLSKIDAIENQKNKPVITWKTLGQHLILFVMGAIVTGLGAFVLVEFGQRLARDMGVSEAVVSLLFISLGTSLPELFTGISAIRKNAEAVSVGNIFGANVLNIVMVLGVSSTISPLQPRDPWLAPFDIPFAIFICTIVFGAGLLRGKVGRKTGISLLLCYCAYIISMIVMGRI